MEEMLRNQIGNAMGFPKFNGFQVHEWLHKCEEFFFLNNTPLEAKVRLVVHNLEGLSLQWHLNYMRLRYHFDLHWYEYIADLYHRFGGSCEGEQHSYAQENQLRSLRNYQIKCLLSKIQATVRSKVHDQLAIPQSCQKASVRTHETPISVQSYELTKVFEINVIESEGSRVNAEKKEKLEEEGQNLNLNFPIKPLTSALAISSFHNDSDQLIGVEDIENSQDEENYDFGRATALVSPSTVFPSLTIDYCSRFCVNFIPQQFVPFATMARVPFVVQLPYFNRCQCFDPGGRLALWLPSTVSSSTAFRSFLLQSPKSITMVDFPAMRSLRGPVSKVCECGFNKTHSSVGITIMLWIVFARQSHAYITLKVFDQIPRNAVRITIECTINRLANVVINLLKSMNKMNITPGKHTLFYCALYIVDNNVFMTMYSCFWVVKIYGFVSSVNQFSRVVVILSCSGYFKETKWVTEGGYLESHPTIFWSWFGASAAIFVLNVLILSRILTPKNNQSSKFIINMPMFMLASLVVISCWCLFGLQRISQCLKDVIVCLSPSSSGFHYGIYVNGTDMVNKYVCSQFWELQQGNTLVGGVILDVDVVLEFAGVIDGVSNMFDPNSTSPYVILLLMLEWISKICTHFTVEGQEQIVLNDYKSNMGPLSQFPRNHSVDCALVLACENKVREPADPRLNGDYVVQSQVTTICLFSESFWKGIIGIGIQLHGFVTCCESEFDHLLVQGSNIDKVLQSQFGQLFGPPLVVGVDLYTTFHFLLLIVVRVARHSSTKRPQLVLNRFAFIAISHRKMIYKDV